MNAIFRVDAERSTIGSGHIIRCANLADELKKKKFKIHFLTRKFDGHLGKFLAKKKFKVSYLENKKINKLFSNKKKVYKKKIQIEEAKKTIQIVKNKKKNFLIVDHYFLNNVYETYLKKYFENIIIIDDLANRKHNCNFLIDQNSSKDIQKKYKKYVNNKTKKLFGPIYSLVNKSFRKYRDKKIKKKNNLKNIFLFMGGSDPTNETAKALEGINISNIKPKILNIAVGSSFKHFKTLRKKLNRGNFNYKLHIQTSKMAKLLYQADLAIISGGFITWEKCVIGTPSLVTIKSHNQFNNSKILEKKGAHMVLGKSNAITSNTYKRKLNNLNISKINLMSIKSRKICDGNGAARVVKKILFLKRNKKLN